MPDESTFPAPWFLDPNIREGDGFYYMANEILVNVEDLSLVQSELDEIGAVRQDVDRPIDRYVALFRVPIDRHGREQDIPALVVRLRRLPGEPRVGPNHALVGEQGGGTGPYGWSLSGQPAYHGGPGGPPWPAPELDTKNDVLDGGGLPPRTVPVAVIDTGLDQDADQLPLFTGRVPRNVNDPDDVYVNRQTRTIGLMGGHGTMVLGVVARHAPNADLISVQVLGINGTANERTVADGMLKAGARHAEILNMSLGGTVQAGQPPVAIDAALGALPPGTVVVAAAGNPGQNPDPNFYPARDPRVVSVAALDTTLGKVPAAFSNKGGWIRACAPGVRIHSAYVRGTWAYGGATSTFPVPWGSWSGTSFAAPYVAARIAASVVAGQTAQQAKDRLLSGLGLPSLADYGTIVVPSFDVTYP